MQYNENQKYHKRIPYRKNKKYYFEGRDDQNRETTHTKRKKGKMKKAIKQRIILQRNIEPRKREEQPS